MTETRSFSLPEEVVQQLERYIAASRPKISASAVATMAFEDFLSKPEVKAKIEASPLPTTEAH